MSGEWWEDFSLEELELVKRDLEAELRGSFRYRPGMFSKPSPLKVPLGEEYLRELEKEGDEEEVLRRVVRKGLRQPGTTKSRLEAYLRRTMERAAEEGRM